VYGQALDEHVTSPRISQGKMLEFTVVKPRLRDYGRQLARVNYGKIVSVADRP
jgi:hypothetical protein